MPTANPLIQGGGVGSAPPVAPAASGPGDTMPLPGGRSFSLPGMGGLLGGADNTNVHVAIVVAAALGVIVLFHLGGFRFAVDAGVTKL